MSDETIAVLPGPLAEPGRVILWERSTEHPGGEVYVGAATRTPVAVARTFAVMQRIRTGALVEVVTKARRGGRRAAAGGTVDAEQPPSDDEREPSDPEAGDGEPWDEPDAGDAAPDGDGTED